MPRPFTPKSRGPPTPLLEGDVIYLAADGRWVRDLHEAEPLDRSETAPKPASRWLLRTEWGRGGPYLTDIAIGGQWSPKPTHFPRGISRRTGSVQTISTASRKPARRSPMYKYKRLRRRPLCAKRVGAVFGPGPPRRNRWQPERRRIPPPASDERALSAAACLYAARRPFPMAR